MRLLKYPIYKALCPDSTARSCIAAYAWIMKARLHETFTADFILRGLLARPLLAGSLTWNRQRLIPFPSVTGHEFYFRRWRNHYAYVWLHLSVCDGKPAESSIIHATSWRQHNLALRGIEKCGRNYEIVKVNSIWWLGRLDVRLIFNNYENILLLYKLGNYSVNAYIFLQNFFTV